MRVTKHHILLHQKCSRLLTNTVEQEKLHGSEPLGFFARQSMNVSHALANYLHFNILIADKDYDKAAKLTERHLAQGDVVAKATFVGDNCTVRCDVAKLDSDGNIIFTEVKSSQYPGSKKKDKHLADIAAQIAIIERSGKKVSSANLALLNPSALGSKAPDLFVITDVTQETSELAKSMDIEAVSALVNGSNDAEPDFCQHCSTCDFLRKCYPDYPDRHAITDIPLISYKKLLPLHKQGIYDARKISFDSLTEKLTDRQKHVVNNWIEGKPIINKEGVEQYFGHIWANMGHLHFLDFESITPAIPMFDHHTPYTKIPFQYSLHTGAFIDENTVKIQDHKEFLDINKNDPTEKFIIQLIKDLSADDYPIVVYSHFEKTTLNDIAKRMPKYASQIEKIINRLIDLCKMITDHVAHPDMNGKTSLKVALPAFAPDLSYSDLKISDGEQAMKAWIEAIEHDTPPQSIKDDLLSYCKRDTQAMVEVLNGILQMR